MKRILLVAFAIVCVLPAARAADNWPQFRGAEARGIAADGNGLPDTWSSTQNIEWKTDLPGRGWSSPIVWGNNVFLTTAVSLEELGIPAPAPEKGLYNGRKQIKIESVFQWHVYCLDLETGGIKWNKKVHEGVPNSATHIKNSFASETPVTDGEHVYAYFGNLGIYAFDFDGNIVWSKTIDAHMTRNGWGTAASPVLHNGRLYIVNDNHEDSYLLALDAKTGDEIWRVSRDEKSNWSTPYIWENGDRTEIVTPGTGLVRSYDLDGKLLWTFSGMSTITVATPYESNGLLYISSGYFQDRKARPLYAIRPGAAGDITLKEGETANEFIAWSDPFGAPYNPSTLVYNDRLYVIYDGGEFASYDAKSGRPIIERERLPRDRWNFTTSPWAYDGKIFCLNEDGRTVVFKDGEELEILHINELAEEDMGMATPALVGDRLLIRTAARLYSIRNDGSTTKAEGPNQADYSLGAFNHDFARLGADHGSQINALESIGYGGLVMPVSKQKQLEELHRYQAAIGDGSFNVYAATVVYFFYPSGELLKEQDAHFDKVIQTLKKSNAKLWIILRAPRKTPDLEVKPEQIVKALRSLAERTKEAGVELVIYPHWGALVETAEEALPYLKESQNGNVFISLNLGHEIKAGNGDRLNEVAAKIKPWLQLAAIHGSDIDFVNETEGWDRGIQPLTMGDYDSSKLLKALKSVDYEGPVLLHTVGLEDAAADHHQTSFKRFQEMVDALD